MISVIGATGFLGPPVLERLLLKSYRVSCLLRPGSASSSLIRLAQTSGNRLVLKEGDLDSPDSIRDSIKDADSAIYMVDLVKTRLLNNFLSAASASGLKRTVFISSTTVLIPLKSRVKDSKLESEALIRNSDLDFTILRPSMIYGTATDPNFSKMLRFIGRRNFFVIFGNGRNLIQPVYIGDVADAVTEVIENSDTYKKTYELPGKDPIEYNEMLEIVKDEMGRDFKIFRLPIGPSRFCTSIYSRLCKSPKLLPGQIDRMAVDKAYSYVDASRDFGFSPIPFRVGISRLITELGLKK